VTEQAQYTPEEVLAAGKRAVAEGKVAEANELAAYMEHYYPDYYSKASGVPPQEPETPLSQELWNTFTTRGQNIADTWKETYAASQDTGEEGPRRPSVGPQGALVNTGGEILSGVGEMAGSTIAAIIPDNIKEWSSEQLAAFFQTPVGQQVGQQIEKGTAAWEEFATNKPQEAQLLANTLNVGASMVGRAVHAYESLGLGDKAKKLKREGLTIKQQKEYDALSTLITPESRVGKGETDAVGPFNTTRYTPDAKEDTVIHALAVDGSFDSKQTYAWNLGNATERIGHYRKELEKLLGKLHRERWDPKDLAENLGDSMEDLSEMPGFHSLVGEKAKVAENYLKDAHKIIKEAKKTPKGLLEARRKFDDIVQAQTDVYGSDADSAKKIIAQHVRNVMNDELKRLGGDDVHHLLSMQSNIITAKSILKKKAEYEANHVLQRTWKTLQRYAHLPSTPLALYTLGAVTAPMTPYVAAGAGVAATGLVGAKLLSKGKRKLILAQTIGGIDKMMKKPYNKAILDTLKADRQALLELMKNPEIDIVIPQAEEEPQE
jgi:hypothetical protein